MPGFPKQANCKRAIDVQIFRPTWNQRKLRPVGRNCQTAFIDALKETIHAIIATFWRRILQLVLFPFWVSGKTLSRRRSADAGQLFAKHHVQHPGAADLCLHKHHTWMIGDYFSDDGGICPKRVLLHLPEHGGRHFRCNDG